MTPEEKNDYEEAFRNMAANLGLEVNTYSGRGMFGETCLSVNTNEYVDTEEIKAEWAAELIDQKLNFKGLYWDQMGLGSVLYLRC